MNLNRRSGNSQLAPLLAGLSIATVLLAPTMAHSSTPATESVPWSVPASTVVVTEQKAFRNAGVELSGTLYVPQGGRALGAIVVTHGASSPLRASPLYGHLKKMLPPLGLAVFIYDRRGSGRSGGDLSKSDYPLLADDAIAAVRMLAADARINPKRIGVWGLSQGGWLSLLAASRSPQIAFAVSVSAPMVTPDVQMMFSSINSMRVNGYPQAEIDQMTATRKAVDDYMHGRGSRAAAQGMVDAAKVKPWFKFLYMSETVPHRATSRWRTEIQHDPLRTLNAVRVPTLVIYGAADPVVPVATSVARLRSVAAEHPNLRVTVVADADHSMQTSRDPRTQLDPSYSDAGAPDALEYFAILSSWLTAQSVAH